MSQPRTSKRVKRTPTKILESVRLDLTLSSSEDELIFETPAVVKVKSASRTWAVASGSGETRLGANVGGTGGAGGREWEPAPSSSQSRRAAGSRKGVAPSAPPLPNLSLDDRSDLEDPKTQLAQHRDLFVGGADCTCGAPLSLVKHNTTLSGSKAMEQFLALGSTQCGTCDKTVCRGCGSPATSSGQCCSAGRAVILYEVLRVLDDTYLADRLHKPVVLTAAQQKAKAKVKKPTKAEQKASTSSIGYGTGAKAENTGGAAGTGYSVAAPAEDPYGYDGYNSYGDGSEFDEEEANYVNQLAKVAPLPPVVAPSANVPKDQAKDAAADKVFTTALETISALLPHPDRDDANVYDFLPHPSLPYLLITSTFVDLLTDLLRNDSVADWTARSELYFAVLSTLEALGESESTLEVLCAERREKRWSLGLGSWMTGAGDVWWDRKVVVASPAKGKGSKKRKAEKEAVLGAPILAPPLFSFLRRLAKQSEAFRRAAATGDSFTAHDSSLIGLCGDITATGERCNARHKIWIQQQQRNGTEKKKDFAPVPPPSPIDPTQTRSKGKGRSVPLPAYSPTDYSSACRALSYDSVILSVDAPGGGKTFPTHYYAGDLLTTANAKRPHGGFVHLAKELAVLSTSLPEGIWLRVDEARIDAIKCMIAGPEGTPYAGGLFEFDIFVPMQYPNTPPLVWLKTTGGGACRFNPNLYATGKVCLSILGTWPGSPEEMWKPTSTILQVLISLQAMILGTNMPYFNEPGYGQATDNQQNRNYNANVSLATVKHAMLSWIDDSKKDGIWGDIIATHFTLNRRPIMTQVASWGALDPRMPNWVAGYNRLSGSSERHYPAAAIPGSVNLVEQLETALDKVSTWRTEAFIKSLLI